MALSRESDWPCHLDADTESDAADLVDGFPAVVARRRMPQEGLAPCLFLCHLELESQSFGAD